MGIILEATKMKRITMVVIGVAILIGVAGCAGIDRSYVRADRLTFEAVAPQYERYVRSDESLDANEKENRLFTVDLWNRRIKEAERVERTQ